jgi:translocation and assembly module TamA
MRWSRGRSTLHLTWTCRSTAPAATRLRRVVVSALLALASAVALAEDAPAPAKAVRITITGVSDQQLAAVRSALSLSAYESRTSIGNARLDRLIGEVPGEVREALQPFGYYQASAVVTTGALELKPRPIEITVARGDPVRVRKVHVAIAGAAARNERIADLIEDFHPGEGEIFDHAVYETSKARVERALQRRGYFDQKTTTARVEINRAANTADIALDWTSGTRYLLGSISFTGAQFDAAFLQRYVPWKDGDRYDQQRIEMLQQSLAASNYFASIEVIPDVERGSEQHVPIAVNLEPAKRSAYSLGASYDADYGAGVRLGLERRWVNQRGHTFASEAEVAQNLSSFTADYRLPHHRDAQRFYQLAARYRDEQTEAVDATSTLYSAGISRSATQWNGTLSLNALQGSFLVGSRDVFDERQRSTVVYPELIVTRVFAADRIRPVQGSSLRVGLRGASESLASDVGFLQAQAEARWIHSFGSKTRLLVRGELGATRTDQFARLPPELRFFAGGDRSVRGYGYQSLGDRDANGTPIGGRYLCTASVEFEREFIPAWSAAVFADAGDVFSNGRPNLSRGIGIGVRWASPVGPIRLDIGHGLDHPDSSFELHISAGPDL